MQHGVLQGLLLQQMHAGRLVSHTARQHACAPHTVGVDSTHCWLSVLGLLGGPRMLLAVCYSYTTPCSDVLADGHRLHGRYRSLAADHGGKRDGTYSAPDCEYEQADLSNLQI